MTDLDPETYVRHNHDTLAKVLKHGTDPFARALALAALLEFGEDPDIEKVRRELNQAAEQEGAA